MPFDFAIAIDRLNDGPISHELRARYPELAHIFDEVDNTRWIANHYEDPTELNERLADASDTAARLHTNLDDAVSRFAQIRDMALVLERIDVERRTDDLIQHISRLADDAVTAFELALRK